MLGNLLGGECMISDAELLKLVMERYPEQPTPFIIEHRFHRISSAYGWRSDPVTGQRRFHSGVDIAAELASTVHAAADGKVIYSGRKGGYGYCVMIRHAYGFVTLYGHLSACYVPEGEEVRSGKVIGFIGSSGKSTGNHLHYEVRKYGRPVRPYIRKRRGL